MLVQWGKEFQMRWYANKKGPLGIPMVLGLFINYLKQSGGEGVNPCVTLRSDGRIKLSFWRYRGGEFWAKMAFRN